MSALFYTIGQSSSSHQSISVQGGTASRSSKSSASGWNHSITISRTWRRTIRWTILWRAWSCRNSSGLRRSRAGRVAMTRGRLDPKMNTLEFRMAGVWLQTGCARRMSSRWEIRLIRLHVQYRMSPCLSHFAVLPRPFKIPSSPWTFNVRYPVLGLEEIPAVASSSTEASNVENLITQVFQI
ncbi:hypothetical protein BDZ89DRAFT_717738 [Hymenopellis radicata]|nr:hypothetical protein BDZ89DRAFT_717738 [Hymenopellis radicata]